jgi:hypothetical protein
LEHRRAKKFYVRVHKGQFARGIAKQQRRERLLHHIKELAPSGTSTQARKRKYGNIEPKPSAALPHIAFEDDEELLRSSPYEHHHISQGTRHKIDLLKWLGDNEDDPALKVQHFFDILQTDLTLF